MSYLVYILFKHPSYESDDNLGLDWNVHALLFKRSKKIGKDTVLILLENSLRCISFIKILINVPAS